MSRLNSLEEALYKTQEKLHESRAREANMVALMREVVGHLSAGDKGMSTSVRVRQTERTL
jgi:hypothetical protein